MREFLKGWRRKAGVVTLVMALALGFGCLWLAAIPGGVRYKTNLTDAVLRCDLTGIHFEEQQSVDLYGYVRGGYVISRLTFPHTSVIGLLGVLSAYLILWKPRKKSFAN